MHRTYHLSFYHLPTGKIRRVTSAKQRNFKGQVIGGGQALKNTEFGWKLGFKGSNHNHFNEYGRKTLDVAAHTSRALGVYDQRVEGAVFVHGGIMVVDHNLAKFTAKYAPKKVKWVSSCHCPVSGELFFKYSGSKEGRGVVEFQGCGIAIVKNKNGNERKIERPACQKDITPGDVIVEPAEPEELEEVDETILD